MVYWTVPCTYQVWPSRHEGARSYGAKNLGVTPVISKAVRFWHSNTVLRSPRQSLVLFKAVTHPEVDDAYALLHFLGFLITLLS